MSCKNYLSIKKSVVHLLRNTGLHLDFSKKRKKKEACLLPDATCISIRSAGQNWSQNRESRATGSLCGKFLPDQFTDQKFIYKVHAQMTRNTLLTSQFAQLQLSFTGTRLRYTLLWDEISTALTDDCSHKVAVMSRIDALIYWRARSSAFWYQSSFKLLCFSWQNTTDKIWIY